MSETRIEHNVETGEILEIELTTEELQELETIRAAAQAEQTAQAEAEEAKAAEKAALLERLGITADEAKLLLGGN
jgi:hypothetical protein